MATTKPRKLSWVTLLSFIMAVLPALLDLLNSPGREAVIALKFDPQTQKLKSSVSNGIEGERSVSRSVTNK